MTKLSQGYNRRYVLYNALCLLLFEITEKVIQPLVRLGGVHLETQSCNLF